MEDQWRKTHNIIKLKILKESFVTQIDDNMACDKVVLPDTPAPKTQKPTHNHTIYQISGYEKNHLACKKTYYYYINYFLLK